MAWPDHCDMEDTLTNNEVKLVQEFCASPFLSTNVSWIDQLIFLFRCAVRSSWKDLESCRQVMQKLANIYRADGDHVLIAATLHNQGLLELKTFQFDEAGYLFKRSVNMLRRLLGENCDNSEVDAPCFQLGIIAEEKSDVAGAEH